MKKTIFVAGMMFAGMASPADIAEKYWELYEKQEDIEYVFK